MEKALFALLFLLAVTADAQARLGETPDQLIARYGQPLSEKDQKAEGDKIARADAVFQKGGFQINVTVIDGVSVLETFRKLNGDPVTVDEVRILLDANSRGSEWAAPQGSGAGKTWTRGDGATATVAPDGSLIIESKALADKEAAAKKLEAHPTLEGF